MSLLQAYQWREMFGSWRTSAADYPLVPGENINLYELPADFPPQMMSLMGAQGSGQAGLRQARGMQPPALGEVSAAGEDEDGLARVLGITAAEAPTHVALNEASLKDRVTDFERQLIEKALADANSNISEAARLLGVKRTTLIEKMGRLNIAKR